MSDADRLTHLKDQPLEIAFEEFAEARLELSLAKIPMIKERIERAMQEEDKIVFFGVHTDFIDALAKEYDNCAVITGKVPVKKRQAQVDMFQNDPDCKYFFGNIQAAGVGIRSASTRAEPTTTPSAPLAMAAECAPVFTPKPTTTGNSEVQMRPWTSSAA